MKAVRYFLVAALILSPTLSKAQTYDLTQGLVFYLPFDGSITDQSNSAIPHAEVNNPALVADRNGNPNSAIEFANLNQSLRLEKENVGALEFGANDFSVGFWVKKNNNTNDWDNVSGINIWNSGPMTHLNEWRLDIGGGDGSNSRSEEHTSGHWGRRRV